MAEGVAPSKQMNIDRKDNEYFLKTTERIDRHTKQLNCEVGLFSEEMIQGSLF